MADQIVLSWTIDIANTVLGVAGAIAAMSGVSLYDNDVTDPVLGQFFGLTVDSDATVDGGGGLVTRTLTLNMVPDNAPPPFPCNPRTSTPPQLPYPLVRPVTLPGSFFVTTGSMTVETTATQRPSLNVGDRVQFLAQRGVFYEVATVSSTQITLTAPFTGGTANTDAFKEVPAPVALDRAAVFSTSNFDTGGTNDTSPVIPAGPAARTVTLIFNDSEGNGPFSGQATLTGRRPALFEFDEPTGADIAEIVSLSVDDTGAYGNSVGQITLVALSDALPDVRSGTTPAQFDAALTDEGQMLIEKPLAYLPPSYFALAQAGAVSPKLSGDFTVTTGSKNVPTSVNLSLDLASGNVIEFASQPGTFYVIDTLSNAAIALTTPYSGLDAARLKVDARLIYPNSNSASPTVSQLAAVLGQYTETQVAGPPPAPPLKPATVPTPTFLSSLFAQRLQLALAGTPVTANQITFLP